MTDLLHRVGRSAFSYLSGESSGGDGGFVGSIVEVDGLRVQVTSELGEGGCAIIYAAREAGSSNEYALKRFLVFDESAVKSVVTEIRLLKELKAHQDIVNFVTAASIEHTEGRKMKEFLVLMELCKGGDLARVLQTTKEPLSPRNVCLALSSLCRALAELHAKHPAVIHRDIKLENLLLDCRQHIKLCDMGSCTTTVHNPNPDWSANQRNLLEDELAKHSTPMYRAPEMLDTWSNYPVNQAVDIWAAGCVLFCVCYNKHPFEDSNKLAIVNGNYKIPANDSRYLMYNPLIKSMLTLDPRQRPTAHQVLEQLSAIAETHGFPTRGSLDLPLPVESTLPSLPTSLPELGPAPRLLHPDPTRSLPTTPDDTQSRLGGVLGSNVSVLKGAAGSIFSKLKDTTKNVVASVQNSMTARELDFHCITSRVGAMSFPVEGLEAAYRNHIEDVKTMMEVQHYGHYRVYNLAERSYPPAKYPSGSLSNFPFAARTMPGLDYLLDILSDILEFLAKDIRNVVVVHCLDGKSSTALVVCALLIYSTFATSTEQAIGIFSSRRVEPSLTPSQVYYLNHLSCLVQSTPPVLKAPFLTISSLIIEPVPLFNRAGEGCTPYVEIFQDKSRAISTLQEYSRMTGYSVMTGDESIIIPVNVTVCGDVTVSIYHTRQVLTKTTGTKICQFQFHTNSLTPGRPTNAWALDRLDCLSEPQRYADNFRIVLNCDTSQECSGKNITWPSPQSKQLLFNSEQDYEATRRLLKTAAGNKFIDNNPGFGKPFPEVGIPVVNQPYSPNLAASTNVKPSSASSSKLSAASSHPAGSSGAFDFLGLSDSVPVSADITKIEITPTEDLISGFSESKATSSQSTQPSHSTGFDFLSDLNEPPTNVQSSLGGFPDLLGASTSSLGGADSSLGAPLLDLVGADVVEGGAPSVPRVVSSPNLGKMMDPFADFSVLTSSMSSQNLLATSPNQTWLPPGQARSSQPMNAQQQQPMGGMGFGGARTPANTNSNSNLLGDFDLFSKQSLAASATATPSTATTSPSASGLNNNRPFSGSNGNIFASTTSPNLNTGKSAVASDFSSSTSPGGGISATGGGRSSFSKPRLGVQGANYSRTFFQESSATGGIKPKVAQSAFDDLLGGFNPQSRDSNQNKTIGAMKKAEVAKTMDPEELKIMDWKEGKEGNIRTLLSSLHKIVWDGARWQECNMSQLVSQTDVKKMYRKACLAVHPDKQMGSTNENLSKLIFMELNEAWSEFENDPKQQNMFG